MLSSPSRRWERDICWRRGYCFQAPCACSAGFCNVYSFPVPSFCSVLESILPPALLVMLLRHHLLQHSSLFGAWLLTLHGSQLQGWARSPPCHLSQTTVPQVRQTSSRTAFLITQRTALSGRISNRFQKADLQQVSFTWHHRNVSAIHNCGPSKGSGAQS